MNRSLRIRNLRQYTAGVSNGRYGQIQVPFQPSHEARVEGLSALQTEEVKV